MLLGRSTVKTSLALVILATGECTMGTIRNKEDAWNTAFGGAMMGAFQGLKHGTMHGIAMGSIKYSSGLALAYMLYDRIKKENIEWRSSEDELKKRFAYASK